MRINPVVTVITDGIVIELKGRRRTRVYVFTIIMRDLKPV
jgi:hypothetical protein